MERTMPNMIIADFLPDEISATVMPLVDSHTDVLPGWVVELDILWDETHETVAKMRPHIDYRRAKLTIGPTWVNATHEMRRRTIIHEFMHVQLGPLHQMGVRLLDIAGAGNEALGTELREAFRIALEQTTVDTTSLVERLLDYCDKAKARGAATPALLSAARGPAISHSNGATP